MKVFNENGTVLNDLLSEYGQPATITEEKTEVLGSDGNGTTYKSETVSESSATSTEWQGNPAYFQTGKKAGQLRPLVNKPKVSFVKSNEVTEVDGELITGALFLSMVDLLLPMLISGIHNYFAKKKEEKIKPEDMMLSATQHKQLSPVADKVVKQIKLSANPTTILVLTMLGLYGMQYAVARMNASLKVK